MSIPHNYVFPALPFTVPPGTSKNDESVLINNLISSFFWKRLNDIYVAEVAKAKNTKYRKKVGSLINCHSNTLKKFAEYKNESYFIKSLKEGFESKFFYPCYPYSKTYEYDQVGREVVALRQGGVELFRKVWLGVLGDVKNNLPPVVYQKHLLLFYGLYVSLIYHKTPELILDLLKLLPVQKNKENYLTLIQHLDLTDKSIREIVVKKMDEFKAKGCDLLESIIYLRDNKISYPEFDKYTDIYKNFDTGFTSSLVVDVQRVDKIKVSLEHLEKTFPLLQKEVKKKKYNSLMSIFNYVLYGFNVDILTLKSFGNVEKDSPSDEYYLIVVGESKIQGVPIVEIMEETLLFLADKMNETRTVDIEGVAKLGKIYLENLLLELTIPKNNLTSKENVIKW